MNAFVLLPLQESMVQRGAGKHDQWQGYMTVLVVNHGSIKSISILTAVSRPMMKSDVNEPRVVFATGPGNPPAVWVLTAKMGRFGSRTVQKPDPLTLGGQNPDPYPSTCGFRRVWLDPSFPISGSAFRVPYLWSPSDMLLLIVKY